MKKRYLMAALAVGIVLTGCSSKNVEISNGDTETVEESVTEEADEADEQTSEAADEENTEDVAVEVESLGMEEDVDFSEFAGKYKANEWSNNMYGGGEALEDLELKDKGEVNCSLFPSDVPKEITKNADGSIHVVLFYDEELSQCYYDLYPAGVVGERDASDPSLKDSVYLRITFMDGGVMDPLYVKQ